MSESRHRPTSAGDDPGRVTLAAWFPTEPAASPAVRAWVSAELIRVGRPPLSADAAMLMSELVTNAIKYADLGPFRIELDLDGRLIVAICDCSPDMPQLRRPGPGDDGGRGLLLVDALADHWGAELHRGGKCVWFEETQRTRAG